MGARRQKVLVVEYEEAARRRIVGALRGAAVETADCGEEALRLLRSRAAVDLLITNLYLPGRYDGLALARQARALRPGLRILYTSAYAEALREDDFSEPCGELLLLPSTRTRMQEAARRALAP